MRWLFIAVLASLVCLILSIGFMNDDSRWPKGDDRSGSAPPIGDNPLNAPAPATQ